MYFYFIFSIISYHCKKFSEFNISNCWHSIGEVFLTGKVKFKFLPSNSQHKKSQMGLGSFAVLDEQLSVRNVVLKHYFVSDYWLLSVHFCECLSTDYFCRDYWHSLKWQHQRSLVSTVLLRHLTFLCWPAILP